MPYLRMVTASGATVQIVYSSHRGSRDIEHLGSAHDDVELELLKAVARRRLAAGQVELDLGLDAAAAGGPLPITGSRMGCLLDALARAYEVLGFERAAGADEVFRGLVVARMPRRRTGPCCGGCLPMRRTRAGRCCPRVRHARRAGPGQPAALRRVHLVLRD